jgi:hypothetical protein
MVIFILCFCHCDQKYILAIRDTFVEYWTKKEKGEQQQRAIRCLSSMVELTFLKVTTLQRVLSYLYG